MDYQFSTLDGTGIKVATCEMPYMESVSFGFWASLGSRDESSQHSGVSHFIEHLLFKGTTKRSALAISRDIEKLGASVDAFTNEEHTCYEVRGPAEHAERLFEIVADFYQNPTFDPTDIENERSVIHEEILMVRDQPSQHLEDLLSYAAWGDHGLGRPITGLPESLDAIDRAALLDYFRRGYAGSQTVITGAGCISHEQMCQWVGQSLGDLEPCEPLSPSAPPTRGSGYLFDAREVEQAHLAIGFHALDRHDDRRFALRLLSTMLGENMSSRLFQRLREDLALCYDVGSEVTTFDDAGLIDCYISLDPANVPTALDAMRGVITGFVEAPPSDSELADAKSYSIGQGRIAFETTGARMAWLGESLLERGEVRLPEGAYERIAAVTPKEVQQVAQEVFRNEQIVLAGVAPAAVEGLLRDFRL